MRKIWPWLIVFQIGFAFASSFGAIDAAYSVRHDPAYVAALKAQEDDPSPATTAAVQGQLHLALEQGTHRRFVRFEASVAGFLVADVLCFYGWRNFRRNLGYKSPAA